jgi:hypothetical protein
VKGALWMRALALAFTHAALASMASTEATRAECERSAGLPSDMSTAAIPHYCFGTFNKEVEVLRACTRYPIDFNRACFHGQHGTPLQMAAGRGSFEMVKLLLDAGADPHAPSPVGWTLIYSAVNACVVQIASHDECLATIKLLRSAGVPIDKPDPNGTTPFWWAMNGNDKQLMEDLIALGADVNHERDWETPLDYATEMRMTKAIEVLERHGAKRASGFSLVMQRVVKKWRYYVHGQWGH